jgi:AcrR family transcriptional regulator
MSRAETSKGVHRRQGKHTQELVYEAARRSFADRGYAETSIRLLAAEVGIEVGSLYRHFASKEELLFNLIRVSTDDLYDVLVDAVDRAGDDPVQRLHVLVEEMTRYHAEHRLQAFVGMVELRELTTAHRDYAVSQRDCVEDLYKSLIAECRDAGYFPGDLDVSLKSKFLVSAGTSIAVWYDPSGALTPQEVAAAIADYTVPLPAS